MKSKRYRSEVAASRGGGQFWNPEEGTNRLRILFFDHVVTEGDIKLGRYDDSVKVGDTLPDEFFVPSRVHFKPEFQVCNIIRRADGSLVGECALCEKATALRQSGLREDKEAARRLGAATRYAMQIVEWSEGKPKLRLWNAPPTIVRFLLDAMDDDMYDGEILLGLEGRDLQVKYDPNADTPQGFYTCRFFDRDKCKELDESKVEGEVQDLRRDPQYLPEWAKTYLEEDRRPAKKDRPKEEPEERKEEEEEPKPKRRKKEASVAVVERPLKKGSTVRFKDTSGDGQVVLATLTEDPREDGWMVAEGEVDGEAIEFEVHKSELLAE